MQGGGCRGTRGRAWQGREPRAVATAGSGGRQEQLLPPPCARGHPVLPRSRHCKTFANCPRVPPLRWGRRTSSSVRTCASVYPELSFLLLLTWGCFLSGTPPSCHVVLGAAFKQDTPASSAELCTSNLGMGQKRF